MADASLLRFFFPYLKCMRMQLYSVQKMELYPGLLGWIILWTKCAENLYAWKALVQRVLWDYKWYFAYGPYG